VPWGFHLLVRIGLRGMAPVFKNLLLEHAVHVLAAFYGHFWHVYSRQIVIVVG